MARPFSQDLWERMVRAVLSGKSRHEVAKMFAVRELRDQAHAAGPQWAVASRENSAAISGLRWLSTRTRCEPLLPNNPIRRSPSRGRR
jgi:hypothetical protein